MWTTLSDGAAYNKYRGLALSISRANYWAVCKKDLGQLARGEADSFEEAKRAILDWADRWLNGENPKSPLTFS